MLPKISSEDGKAIIWISVNFIPDDARQNVIGINSIEDENSEEIIIPEELQSIEFPKELKSILNSLKSGNCSKEKRPCLDSLIYFAKWSWLCRW